jgi:hypothetical protein
MPGYVTSMLMEFYFTPSKKPEHQPHQHQPPQYGVKTQSTAPIDNSELLNKEGNLRLQQITRKFQYYSRAVDPTMNVALSTLASQQTCGTKLTETDSNKFLNYCTTHPDATI